LIFN